MMDTQEKIKIYQIVQEFVAEQAEEKIDLHLLSSAMVGIGVSLALMVGIEGDDIKSAVETIVTQVAEEKAARREQRSA